MPGQCSTSARAKKLCDYLHFVPGCAPESSAFLWPHRSRMLLLPSSVASTRSSWVAENSQPVKGQLAISGGPTVIVQEPFGGIQKSGGVGDMVDKDGRYGGQLHKITQTLEGFEEHEPGDVRGRTSRMLRGERELGQRRCEAAL
jgi:hypothetical protein